MRNETRDALTNRATWLKGPTFLLFYLLLAVATPVLILISLFGWIMQLIKGQVPGAVLETGASLADWYMRATRYLTGNASRRPFPFEDLDCPRDDPAPVQRSVVAERSPSASARPSSMAVDDSAATDNFAGQPAETQAGKSAGRKKAGNKKAGKKKVASKKAAGKKKSGRKKAATRKKASIGTSSEKETGRLPPAADQSADASETLTKEGRQR